MSANVCPIGFGSYELPLNQTFSQMQIWEKVHHLFFSIVYGMVCIGSFLIPIVPFQWVYSGLFFYAFAKSALKLIASFYRNPPTQSLIPRAIQAVLAPLNQSSVHPIQGLITRDGTDSHQWKLRLIQKAQKNIVLSGCYCGGSAFDEALDLIKQKLQALPHLTVKILASNLFITAENQKRIAVLSQKFQNRFTYLETSELIPSINPKTGSFFFSTQHTKALVIDSGRAFILGGSGIVTLWSKERGNKAAKKKESHGFFYDHFFSIKGFRDVDFVFQSNHPHGIGARIFVEMIKLCARFQKKIPVAKHFGPIEPLTLDHAIPNLKAACYASGPENPDCSFLDEMIAQVKKARKEIVIGHLYFHPPPELLQALLKASNRGVQITIITNKWHAKSPGTHMAYAELSKYFVQKLLEGKQKPNVKFWEFEVPYVTYHKKVMVFDGLTTLLGSSNIGVKSLQSIDYEINLKIESENFAAEVLQNLKEDQNFCQQNTSIGISCQTKTFAFLQSFFTPFL